MNTFMFGIVIGLVLYFGGERFIKVAIRALKEREEIRRNKLVEIVTKIVNDKE